MRLYSTWIALTLCWPLLAMAAELKQESKLPPAREIIAKHIEAIGGKEAFKKIDSQRMEGKFEMPAQGLSGKLTAYGKRPDKLFIKITLPGVGDMLQGYDGEVAWAMNLATGPMLLEGTMLEQVKEQAQFDSMLHEEQDFKEMETVEVTEFGGKQCYKLRLVRQSGREVIEYYDRKSGLLVGTTEAQETPLGLVTVTSVAEEYKRFGALLFATKLTQKLGPITQVITISEIEFNKVDDSVFELPEEIKALAKK
jgi:hypothetical protein